MTTEVESRWLTDIYNNFTTWANIDQLIKCRNFANEKQFKYLYNFCDQLLKGYDPNKNEVTPTMIYFFTHHHMPNTEFYEKKVDNFKTEEKYYKMEIKRTPKTFRKSARHFLAWYIISETEVFNLLNVNDVENNKSKIYHQFIFKAETAKQPVEVLINKKFFFEYTKGSYLIGVKKEFVKDFLK